MSRDRYNTEQLSQILEVVKSFNGNFEIKQVEDKLINKVGPATIYRQIKKLIEEGKIKKQLVDGVNLYCYIGECENENHFNLLCKSCGKIQHAECNCLNKFCKDIAKEHDFQIDNDHLIIDGYCKECKK